MSRGKPIIIAIAFLLGAQICLSRMPTRHATLYYEADNLLGNDGIRSIPIDTLKNAQIYVRLNSRRFTSADSIDCFLFQGEIETHLVNFPDRLPSSWLKQYTVLVDSVSVQIEENGTPIMLNIDSIKQADYTKEAAGGFAGPIFSFAGTVMHSLPDTLYLSYVAACYRLDDTASVSWHRIDHEIVPAIPVGKDTITHWVTTTPLSSPYPFGPTNSIAFRLSDTLPVSLFIYSNEGRCVDSFILGTCLPGYYEQEWNPSPDLPSGIYFYKLIRGDSTEIKKMILMK
jgi:hypothetical protein